MRPLLCGEESRRALHDERAPLVTDRTRPIVIPEHSVVPARKRAPVEMAARMAAARIDLLFEWLFGSRPPLFVELAATEVYAPTPWTSKLP